MERYLIVYATTEGHTRNVAERIAQEIRSHGFQADVHDCLQEDAIDLGDDYAGFIVGASVHQGKHQPSILRFIQKNRERLQHAPSAFFSVSLESALPGDEHQQTAERYIDELLEESSWRPDRTWTVAGALRYTEYDFFKRFVMKLIARREGQDTDTSKDHVYTDWEKLERDVEYFLKKAHGMHEEARATQRQQG